MWSFLVLSLLWTEQVGAEERMYRQAGSRGWRWRGWNELRWTEGTGLLHRMCFPFHAWRVGVPGWVARLDVGWEIPVVWGLVREDPDPSLGFLFVVDKEV